MQIAKSIRLGTWILISLNLIMALGSIAIFIRMAPAIADIIDKNDTTLLACHEMLTALAKAESVPSAQSGNQIRSALAKAETRIHYDNEKEALDRIAASLDSALAGEASARNQTVLAINELAHIHRQAMHTADIRAQQIGQAGAWSVVLMASLSFFGGLVFLQVLQSRFVEPIEEIHAVIEAHRSGDPFRRCAITRAHRDFRLALKGLNDILDQKGPSKIQRDENEIGNEISGT